VGVPSGTEQDDAAAHTPAACDTDVGADAQPVVAGKQFACAAPQAKANQPCFPGSQRVTAAREEENPALPGMRVQPDRRGSGFHCRRPFTPGAQRSCPLVAHFG